MPDSSKGIPESERTFAQQVQASGYRTACIGKWHLGMAEGFAPRAKGFDEFFGVPYSNDMRPFPMLWNEEVVESETDNSLLTRRYTERAVQFIEENKRTPFLMYLAHNAPHIPLGVSPEFRKKTGMGKYGDVVAELDWGVGEVMKALSRNGLDENTLVIFTSDNGPWYQGSAGRLRGRKGETYDGGTRVPFIARMSGRIREGSVNQGLTSLMDVMPTIATLTGCGLPGQAVDGVDLTPALMGETEAIDRGMLLFFDGWHAQCAREGNWKLHMARYNSPPWLRKMGVDRENLPLCHPELYDVVKDPGENYDRAEGNPQVVEALSARMESLIREFPNEVVTSWDDTRRKRVWSQPEGAPPVADTP
jgi:arylsulfatase